MKIEVDKKYKIIATDPLFSDWFGVIAMCKKDNSGVYEMHANNAFIFCRANQLSGVRANLKA